MLFATVPASEEAVLIRLAVDVADGAAAAGTATVTVAVGLGIRKK